MTRAAWQAAITRVPQPRTGCYQASYPALHWRATACGVAPKLPLAPALPSAAHTVATTVGNGHDYSAVVSGSISRATGTFQNVSPNITEKGKIANTGSKIANAFTLQLNTEFFKGSLACAKAKVPSDCLAWQQFVYDFYKGTGQLYMQYWLIRYNATCPTGWWNFAASATTNDCYTNSPGKNIKKLTAAELATVKFSGSAVSGGQDGVSLSLGSGTATLVSNLDSQIGLGKAWNTTEWGVFGDGSGGEAYFGAGTTLEAVTALTTTSTSTPECVVEGFTAETNNLTLAKTPALGTEPSPTLASEQTNGTPGTASCAVAS